MNRSRRSHLGGGIAVIAALPWLSMSSADAETHVRHCHHCRNRPLLEPYGNDFYPPPIDEGPPPSGYPPFETSPQDEPPLVVEPSPRPQNAPYAQGFTLDVATPTSDGDQAPASQPVDVLTRYRQVADRLGQCWRPPSTFGNGRWGQVTLRVSFKSDGTINGVPRIPFVGEGLTDSARSDLRQSLVAALHRCTPLNLSPGLGAAIAGQIFALRFIEQEPQR